MLGVQAAGELKRKTSRADETGPDRARTRGAGAGYRSAHTCSETPAPPAINIVMDVCARITASTENRPLQQPFANTG